MERSERSESEIDLTKEEVATLRYFVRNRSVGEMVAVRELQVLEGISDPLSVIRSLMEKGLISRGRGCFNLNIEAAKRLKSL